MSFAHNIDNNNNVAIAANQRQPMTVTVRYRR